MSYCLIGGCVITHFLLVPHVAARVAPLSILALYKRGRGCLRKKLESLLLLLVSTSGFHRLLPKGWRLLSMPVIYYIKLLKTGYIMGKL